jgi:hypothetical protein
MCFRFPVVFHGIGGIGYAGVRFCPFEAMEVAPCGLTCALHWAPGGCSVSISNVIGSAPVRANVSRMNVVLLCLGLLLGVCGWGFLAAAVLAFPDTDRSAIRAVPWPVLCLDMIVSLGVLTMTFLIVRNWRRITEMQPFVRVGVGCLLSARVLLWLCFVVLR